MLMRAILRLCDLDRFSLSNDGNRELCRCRNFIVWHLVAKGVVHKDTKLSLSYIVGNIIFAAFHLNCAA